MRRPPGRARRFDLSDEDISEAVVGSLMVVATTVCMQGNQWLLLADAACRVWMRCASVEAARAGLTALPGCARRRSSRAPRSRSAS